MSKKPYQGNRDLAIPKVGINLSCISPEGSDLLDSIIQQCPTDIREGSVDIFLAWLQGSGLIDTDCTVEQLCQADNQFNARLKSRGLERKDAVYYGRSRKPSSFS